MTSETATGAGRR